MDEGYATDRVRADQNLLAQHPVVLAEGPSLRWERNAGAPAGPASIPSDWWKVGRYHEWLCDRMLAGAYGRPSVWSGIQLRHEGRTLGELDHLIHTGQSTSGWVHLEVAYKFYLHLPGTHAWLGPNPVDRFDLKLAQMRDRQTPLLRSPQAREALAADERVGDMLPLDGDVDEATVLRLECFTHVDASIDSPSENTARLGRWCTRAEARSIIQEGNVRGIEEHRPYWLAPSARAHQPIHLDALEPGSTTSVPRTQLFSLSGPMVQSGQLASRLMVVNDAWPQDAHARVHDAPLRDCASELPALLRL